MESVQIYKDSYDYMNSLKKSIEGSEVSINFSKLDSKSSGLLKQAIRDVLTKRTSEVSTIIMNSTNNSRFY